MNLHLESRRTSTIDAQILTALRSAGDSVSGADLAQQLCISRAAVWARIEELRALGYDIAASPHTGYRLLSAPDVLHADDLLSRLGMTRIQLKISMECRGGILPVFFRVQRLGAAKNRGRVIANLMPIPEIKRGSHDARDDKRPDQNPRVHAPGADHGRPIGTRRSRASGRSRRRKRGSFRLNICRHKNQSVLRA